jgi:hypothetical protein
MYNKFFLPSLKEYLLRVRFGFVSRCATGLIGYLACIVQFKKSVDTSGTMQCVESGFDIAFVR